MLLARFTLEDTINNRLVCLILVKEIKCDPISICITDYHIAGWCKTLDKLIDYP